MNPIESIVRKLMKWPNGIVTVIVVLLICYATLVPKPLGDNEIPLFPGADKVVHFIMFAALSIAIAFDRGRYVGDYKCVEINRQALCFVVLASSFFGGLIELLQGSMALGRSSDLFDFIADVFGAVFGVTLFYYFMRNLGCTGLDVTVSDGESVPLSFIEKVYVDSFPLEERRPWDSFLALSADKASAFNVSTILCGGQFAGFISWWEFPQFIYVEHFAIVTSMRNSGIGSKSIKRFIELHSQKGVVLEAEMPGVSDEAKRRIIFYRRCGFEPHYDFKYVQPPYSPGLPSIEMMLVSYGLEADLSTVAARIHKEVYGA